jgi:predicted metalloendopeptidase
MEESGCVGQKSHGFDDSGARYNADGNLLDGGLPMI